MLRFTALSVLTSVAVVAAVGLVWKGCPLTPATAQVPPPTPSTHVQTKINPKDGAEMVYIPEGEFTMGSKDYDAEKPPHKVNLDGYWMYKYEVTVGQYRKFCSATNRKMWGQEQPDWNKGNYPVVNVSWEHTQAYCKWAGVRLPTEAEWEYAARGGRQLEYGTATGDLSHDLANYSGQEGRDQWEYTSPVGSFPANPFGLHDMAGNVWEWCSSLFKAYPSSATDGREGAGLGARVVRGGSWLKNAEYYCRAGGRGEDYPDFRSGDGGFRCVALR